MSHPALPRALVGLPWRLLLVVAGVGLFGLVVLFSAAGGSLTPWAANQGVRFVVFFAAMIALARVRPERRSEEHTSELQSLIRISYAVFCLKKKIKETRSINKNS